MKRSEEQKLEQIIRRMQTDTSIDAPVDSIKYVKNLYRTRAAEPKQSVIQRMLAVMRVDLAPNRAAFGERSASESEARQMLFESGANAVDLRIKAIPKGFDIRGQILGNGFENGEIEIADKQNGVKAKINAMSEFRLSGVTAGEYSLTIRGAGTEIFIEQIILK